VVVQAAQAKLVIGLSVEEAVVRVVLAQHT
jgi:hypothetical protein